MHIDELALPGRTVIRKRAADALDLAHLRAEASILQGLNHRGVVKLVDATPPLDVNGIQLAKVGPSLAAFRALTPLEVAGVISSLGRTLADLHDRGIVHSHIDSTHVLLAPDGNPVLCSFGQTDIDVTLDIHGIGGLIYSLLQPQAGAGNDDDEQTRARLMLLEIADACTSVNPDEQPYPDEVSDLIDEHLPLRFVPDVASWTPEEKKAPRPSLRDQIEMQGAIEQPWYETEVEPVPVVPAAFGSHNAFDSHNPFGDADEWDEDVVEEVVPTPGAADDRPFDLPYAAREYDADERRQRKREEKDSKIRSSFVMPALFGATVVAIVGALVVILGFVRTGDQATPLGNGTSTSSSVPSEVTTSSVVETTEPPVTSKPPSLDDVPPTTQLIGVQEGRCPIIDDAFQIDMDLNGCADPTKYSTATVTNDDGTNRTILRLSIYGTTKTVTINGTDGRDKFAAGRWGRSDVRYIATYAALSRCVFVFDTWDEKLNLPSRAVAKLDDRTVKTFESRPTGDGASDQLLVVYEDDSFQLIQVPSLPEAPAADSCR